MRRRDHRPPVVQRATHLTFPFLAGLALLLGSGCVADTASNPPVPPPPPLPTFAGHWSGSFDMSEVKIGGILPVPPHSVDLELTLADSGGKVEGLGSVTHLLGQLATLAMVSGAQRGKAFGVVVDGVAEISLDIPPFGAPPAPASVIFKGTATTEGLVGTCHANIAGGESSPAPCTLSKPTPTPAPRSPSEVE